MNCYFYIYIYNKCRAFVENDEKFEKRGVAKFVIAKASDKADNKTKQNGRKRLVSGRVTTFKLNSKLERIQIQIRYSSN